MFECQIGTDTCKLQLIYFVTLYYTQINSLLELPWWLSGLGVGRALLRVQSSYGIKVLQTSVHSLIKKIRLDFSFVVWQNEALLTKGIMLLRWRGVLQEGRGQNLFNKCLFLSAHNYPKIFIIDTMFKKSHLWSVVIHLPCKRVNCYYFYFPVLKINLFTLHLKNISFK